MLQGIIGAIALVAIANGYVVLVQWGTLAQFLANALTIIIAGVIGGFSIAQKYADSLHWDTETRWRAQGFSAMTGVLSVVGMFYVVFSSALLI